MRAKRDGADIPKGFEGEDILWVWVEITGLRDEREAAL
jgi:hypothetical protein